MTPAVKKQLAQTGVWTGISVVVAILAVLLLSTVDGPDGKPWLESSTIAQTLSLLAVVAAAVLPSILGTRKDAAEVRDQVQNDHRKPDGTPLNLRDDLDDKHDLVLAGLGHLTNLIEGVIEDQRAAREAVTALTKRVDTNSRRLATIKPCSEHVPEEHHD